MSIREDLSAGRGGTRLPRELSGIEIGFLTIVAAAAVASAQRGFRFQRYWERRYGGILRAAEEEVIGFRGPGGRR
jgi:hypothetical protein